MTAPTNSEGRIMVTYTEAQFGGRYVLIARTNMDGRNLEARDTLTVRVPGLVELPEAVYYERIGGRYPHSSNHWCTQAVMERVQSIAMVWFLENPNEALMMINDMSLEYGGLFDVRGNWQSPHDSHRIGTDVDVRTELPGLRRGIPTRIPRNATDWRTTTWIGCPQFIQICRIFGGNPERHSANTIFEHYHIDF